MTERVAPAHVLPVPRWTLIIPAAQALLAVIILGLSAYAIDVASTLNRELSFHWINYNGVAFALSSAIFTLLGAAYILVSTLFLHKVYNQYAVLAVLAVLTIFWITALGLVANLARIWSGDCVNISGYGSYCGSYSYGYDWYKRSLSKRDEFKRTSFYGTLAANAFFCAAEFGLCVGFLIIHVMFMNKHRSANAAAAAQHPPPQYTDPAHPQPAVPMEKYSQTQTPQYPQNSYSAVSTPQPTYAQPAHSHTPPVPMPATYQHEPVGRNDTVSPLNSQYTGNAAELNTPTHTGYPGAAELNTPTHTGYPGAAELNTPAHTGGHNGSVSELGTPGYAGGYHGDASELSSGREDRYRGDVSELSSR